MKYSTAGPLRTSQLIFLLGGHDLEMLEIRRLIEAAGAGFVDKGLSWGARMSDYRTEIEAALATGQTPVTVELADDMADDWAPRRRMIVVDHHGGRAGDNQPSSLEQVFGLLGLPKAHWTRRMTLVAANDIGHVERLQRVGATREEILAIRAEDRAAQGVTAADEAEAARAISLRRREGRLTIVETASSTSSAIADGMLPITGGPGYDALLVVMPAKAAVFADGAAIARLAAAFPASWHGGALPHRGFWGAPLPVGEDRAARITDIIRLTA